jgi:carboxyl-terminal processing protease
MMRPMRKEAIVGLHIVAVLLLASCGGGDSSGGGSKLGPGDAGYTPGVYKAASTYAAQCQTPRVGTDPGTGAAYPDRRGSITAENNWLRSWTNDLYLWYQEVPDINPASVGSTEAYFDQMKSTTTLPSGQRKDRFHFTYDTEQYRQLSGSGVAVGYGLFLVVRQGTPPRKVLVTFVEPGSPAAVAGVTRGAQIMITDGVDVVNDGSNAGVNSINNALSPRSAGESHQFVFKDRGTGANRSVSLTAAAVTMNPVPVTAVLNTPAGNLGYLLFNDHVATAESRLATAITTLSNASIQDLVLDLRYNGGGYLAVASELAYMIAGPAATTGRTFERLQFNSRYPTTNPVTGAALSPTPFYSTARGLSLPAGQALPTLNLPRVYVLTSSETCSASESIINGLRGVGITVYQFGPDTCGKPYGFYPEDNCGTTYFSIQFKGVNHAGFGDYVDGFSVTRNDIEAGARLPGCTTADDLTRDLGDTNEEQLRVARVFRETGACTGSPVPLPKVEPASAAGDGLPIDRPDRGPWHNNRILR